MLKTIKKISENKKFNFWLNLFLLACLIVLGIILIIQKSDTGGKKNISRDKNENYLLTSPILDCENAYSSEVATLNQSDIKKEISRVKEVYGIEQISLYYRDLNNGPWLGINEEEKFSPASLLKIPVAMALMKYAEDKQGILEKKIVPTKDQIAMNQNQNITFEGTLEAGKEYTLLEVMESMLKKSDNSAVYIIYDNLPEYYIDNVFLSMGVPYQNAGEEVFLRVKDYAAFFRVLFNSSYLNRQNSEKLLEILTNTDYKDGLIAGISDKNIIVAHKFGERILGDSFQLHDCGIIYHSDNPYLLCVMTKGHDFYKQQTAIQIISKFIYNKISQKVN
ncbi:MAG TPA: class A beta-lactamase-related serine hydrolase [Candidatus Paceibacterota bacterium]|nr:class A beta-lactamase-related serine hydrolase [Candidatus Paceibacterota bacterium]HPR84073.1 class A beta-lactamase-related serine hydrolase [Candidatus Paceibacterota bacterium]